MSKDITYSFKDFVNWFPEISLPITLSEESSGHFAKANPPMPASMIAEFLSPIQKEDPDDMTEFLACFRIPGTKAFHGLVYWKAGLLTYEYILATFTKKGVLIDQQVLAGTKAEGSMIARTVATIDDEWTIFIVGGIENSVSGEYDGTHSESLALAITPTGQIQIENAE